MTYGLDVTQGRSRSVVPARPLMVSEVLRFLSLAGKAGILRAHCAGPVRRLNLTFTRL
ncbi:hypothetical protein [Bradyrhizobium iriomotense]|uniref:hypothetical protein n=1 Tax=Bradyrhizobium iriomotense TaxID=441950 RepID=UPI001B8A74F5|nr:hypothetical protein [Bradyrhizobium iriomotense]MBR0781239.1 hypothetical protein [Bradyrhizobium iriomotense]